MIETRIKKSETRQFKIVFPSTLNDHDTLFGGMAMKWMDEVAYITATRFSRMKMVTVATNKIKFLNAAKAGTIAEVVGTVKKVGAVKIDINVEIFVEEMYSDKRIKAVETVFTFAAIDDNHKPVRIALPNSPDKDKHDSKAMNNSHIPEK